ncbi:helix-turn-helix domain-containing protein [Ideonella sp.]|jgi:AraC family ethanolamine operon transcriptional activator|uniref:helix-turn-helix domain-containing protein n=1 Tax=Ideonella sp. TaxID=1929293 RepID=UPI0037C0A8C8
MVKIVEHQSRDVDDQAQALDGWQQRYEQLSAGRFEGHAWQLVMNEGTLLREHTNRHLREQITPPPGHLVLAVPLAVMPGSTFGGRPLDRESLLIFGADDEYDLVSAGELDLIGLSVHRDVLAGLAPSKVEWLERAQQERNLGLSPDSASAIRQMLMAVTAQTEEDGALDRLEGRGQAEELLTATLTQTVILAMHSEESHQAQTIPRRADTRLKVVKRAIEYMRAHLHEDIGVPEICAAAFASRRSLQYCFEEFMQTTPQAYLRALRLNEARRALKLRTDLPITVIASDLGFSSASHFTRHYKLMFDELPSETLKACGLGSSTSLF